MSTNDMPTKIEIQLLPGPSIEPTLLSTGTVPHLVIVDAGSIDVGADDDEIEFELSWDNNWTHYQGNDLELLVFTPPGSTLPSPLPFVGQTLDAPEKFVINPDVLAALYRLASACAASDRDVDHESSGIRGEHGYKCSRKERRNGSPC